MSDTSRSAERERFGTQLKGLKSKDTKTKLRAIEQIAAEGELADCVALEICEAISDSNSKVATSALSALERVRPDLYKHVSAFLLDAEYQTRVRALKDIGAMGVEGKPAAPILVTRLRIELGLTDKTAASRKALLFEVLHSIGANDVQTIKFMKSLASHGNHHPDDRIGALRLLASWASGDETHKKELIPILKAGLGNRSLQKDYLKYAGEFGTTAKELLPLIRQLKLSPEEATRAAADKALEQIEQQ